MLTHKWQFPSRFRRNAYGWKSSKLAVERLKEAVSEIKQVSRKEPVLAADGAVALLQKLSPALEQVDSSSGALGGAISRTIETLVPLIANADVDEAQRRRWLDSLWQAMRDDEMPMIETLGDYWGELCGTPEIAAEFADTLMPAVLSSWTEKKRGAHFFGIIPCLSCLYAAKRHVELLVLLEHDAIRFWHYQVWGVKALVALGENTKAIEYAEALDKPDYPSPAIARICEEIMLSSGMASEAYARYAIRANQGTNYLATFRAIAKKYPGKPKVEILRDLIAGTPGNEGKWFAAAKDAGLFDLAVELIERSPTDPKTLTRAARDYAEKQPAFALSAGLASLRWMSLGYGFELVAFDALDAYYALQLVAPRAGVTMEYVNAQIRDMIAAAPRGNNLVREYLDHLVDPIGRPGRE